MQKMQLPDGYNTVMPYLILKDAKWFLEFAKQVFGATEKMMHAREEDGTLMHGEIMIGDSLIMFAQGNQQFAPQPAGMFICVADADETYRKALEAGATSIMPPADQDYGRACGVADKCDNTWWITKVKV
jgi:Uncharacterized protein conserved in bacteria